MNLNKIQKKIDIPWLTKKASKISLNDLKKTISNLGEIYDKIKNNKHFEELIADVKTLGELIKDYFNGEYKAVPWLTIAFAAFALLYIFSPIDLIPDFFPGGLLDDATVVALVLKMIKGDLENYREWKR